MDLEVIVGTYNGTILGLSCDILTKSFVLRPKFNESTHLGMVSVLSSSQGILASGSSDETIKLFNMKDHTELGTLMLHEGTITGLEFCQNKLISCSSDGLICVWNTRTWECVHTLRGHRGAVQSVAVHPSGKLLLSVGKDRTIRTWDLATGKQAFKKHLTNVPELVQWSPVGDQYLIGYENHKLSIDDVESGKCEQEIDVAHHINSVVFIQDSVIAVGSESPDVLIYSTQNGRSQATLTGHQARVKQLNFIPGVELLFSASSNGTVKMWKINMEEMSFSECVCELNLSSHRLTSMTLILPSEDLLIKNRSSDDGKVLCSQRAKKKTKCTSTDDLTKQQRKQTRSANRRKVLLLKKKKLTIKRIFRIKI